MRWPFSTEGRTTGKPFRVARWWLNQKRLKVAAFATFAISL
jgi:hypothetical protein